MTIDSIDKILEREITERRRSRFYVAGLSVAIVVILAAMATAM